MSSASRSRKRRNARHHQRRAKRAASPAIVPPMHGYPTVQAEIERGRHTDEAHITMVPTYPNGDTGSPTGSRGSYDVVALLGVPPLRGGVDAITPEVWDTGGDSLIMIGGLSKYILANSSGETSEANVEKNEAGRVARLTTSVEADDFNHADAIAYDFLNPILSIMSYQTDTPLGIVATRITERASMSFRVIFTMAGAAQNVEEKELIHHLDLQPLLSAYRDGLNSNSPLFQAVSFYKVIVAVEDGAKRRSRAAKKNSIAPEEDVMSHVVPTEASALGNLAEWEVEPYRRYLGMTYAEVKKSVTVEIRNAAVHLRPEASAMMADRTEDARRCQTAVPILRYVARNLLHGEIERVKADAAKVNAFGGAS